MNWKKLSESYPKAWERFFSRYNRLEFYGDGCLVKDHTNGHSALGFKLEFDIRHLYDFFDEEGIIVGIEYDERSSHPFNYGIDSGGEYYSNISEKTFHATRTEAEQQAFLKGFEILESRLEERLSK